MSRKLMIAFLALALVFAACTDDGGEAPTTGAPGSSSTSADSGSGGGLGSGAGVGVPAFAAALQQFDQCDALLTWIQSEAVERVGPYGFNDGGYWPVMRALVEEDAALGGPATTAAADFATAGGDDAGDGGVEFSGTNVQEIGVDEPDVVKTDGEFLYVLVDNQLKVVRADADRPEVVDSLSFGDEVYPSSLLLGTDRLYVLGSHYVTDFAALERIGIPAYEQELFVVYEVMVGADGSVSSGSRLEISGGLVTARAVDGGARIVMRHHPGQSLPFVYPGNPSAEESAAEANRQVILDSTIEDWLPWYRLIHADGEESGGLLPDCNRVTAPQTFSGMSTVSVLTLDMNAPLGDGNALSLFGAADTVYASTSSLYAATYEFPPVMFADDGEIENDPEFETAIHQFDITDLAGATYVASGSVPGHLLNQFAMSEYDGHLRVATTEGSPWWCCGEQQSSSSVTVLRAVDGELKTTGAVGDLGIGEQIFGVRFVGDTGYVVTFRQTDPLYVIDLRNPEAPEVTGELKITGYSSYLHPVGEGYVVGVGQEATLEGNTIGTKVSLFDVRDPRDPREVDRWVLEQSNSMAEWDHKAFLYWAPESAAVIPVRSWRGEQFGAVALDVAAGVLTERGRITQGELGETGPPPGCEVVDPDDIDLDEDSELFWLFQEGGLVLRCDDDLDRSMPNYYCEPFEAFGFGPGDTEAVRGDAESVSVCWPDFDTAREIRRSVVIDDVLWTIGYRSVQSNDFASLRPMATIDL